MQETGRAGRDGSRADCYLLYSYGDKNKIEAMIMKSEGDERQKAQQRQMLLQMISYAENSFECRRKLMLHYFHETFDAASCKRTCDNCASGRCAACEMRDMSEVGRGVLALVYASRAKVSLTMAVDAAKGCDNKTIRDKRLNDLPGYGVASSLKRTEVEKVIRRMVIDGFLSEGYDINENYGGITAYLRPGERADALRGGQVAFCAPFATAAAGGGLDVEGGGPTGAYGLAGGAAANDGNGSGMEGLIEALVNELKELRKEWKTEKQAAYVVFTNKQASELAQKLPFSVSQVREVSGFGETRTKNYGPRIVAAVTRFVDRHPELEPLASANRQRASAEASSARPPETIDLIEANRCPVAGRGGGAAGEDPRAAGAGKRRAKSNQPVEDDDPDFAPTVRGGGPSTDRGGGSGAPTRPPSWVAGGGGSGGGGGGGGVGGGHGLEARGAAPTASPYFGQTTTKRLKAATSDPDAHLFGEDSPQDAAGPGPHAAQGTEEWVSDEALLAMDMPGMVQVPHTTMHGPHTVPSLPATNVQQHHSLAQPQPLPTLPHGAPPMAPPSLHTRLAPHPPQPGPFQPQPAAPHMSQPSHLSQRPQPPLPTPYMPPPPNPQPPPNGYNWAATSAGAQWTPAMNPPAVGQPQSAQKKSKLSLGRKY